MVPRITKRSFKPYSKLKCLYAQYKHTKKSTTKAPNKMNTMMQSDNRMIEYKIKTNWKLNLKKKKCQSKLENQKVGYDFLTFKFHPILAQ